MTRSHYLVGIDLGTTNCAVAYVDTHGRERPAADIRNFPVPQLVAPGETAPRAMLPSFLYLPGEHELPPGAAGLPWSEGAERDRGRIRAVSRGEGARPQRLRAPRAGSAIPGSTAKPTSCPGAARRRSRRSRRSRPRPPILRHIRDAWNDTFARDDDSMRLEQQEVVLTVPASFDEAARELTLEAAKRAELASVTLLEEPQAAFYCWIVSHQDRWQKGGSRRRADPGLRHRRRHDRLQPDHGRRDADRAGIPPRRRRRSPDAGRRQHRPGAGPSRREEAGRRAARLRAMECPAVGVPHGQGEAAGRRAAGARALAGHDRGPRVEADRRQHPGRADAARGRGDRGGRFLPGVAPR